MDRDYDGLGVAVMSAVFVAIACGSRDAHINPAVTLGFAVATESFGKGLPYLAAQMLGGFFGAAFVWIHFGPHWKETEDPHAKLVCFCGIPAIRNFPANLGSGSCPRNLGQDREVRLFAHSCWHL